MRMLSGTCRRSTIFINRDTAFCSFLKLSIMVAKRKITAAMLIGLMLAAVQIESSAQTRGRSDRKQTTTRQTTVSPSRGATSRSKRPTSSASVRPTRPTTPATSPSRPAVRPNDYRPSGPQKPNGYRPSGPQKPPMGLKPGAYYPKPKPGPKPGYRPVPRPRPIIVHRPSYGSIIATNIAANIVRNAVRVSYYSTVARTYNRISANNSYIASQNAVIAQNNATIALQNQAIASAQMQANAAYIRANQLGLVQSYAAADQEYYYQDGVFYIVDASGQYRVIVPPAGAVVEYLPEDYTVVMLGGDEYYKVDNTIFTLKMISGKPYFEVLGQM